MGKKKKAKKNYKQFPIIKLEDGLMALGSLISSVNGNLKKYKEYAQEIDDLLEHYSKIDDSCEVLIPAKIYDDINDKLLYRQREMLKYIADHQKDSFSYINLRKLLIKNNHLSSMLNSEIEKLLQELLDVRNWTFHNTQSMMVAHSEVTQKRIPEAMKNSIKIIPQLNPWIMPNIENYDLLMLATLSIHVENRISQFEKVFSKMKEDYNEMYQKVSNKPFLLMNGGLSANAIFIEQSVVQRFADASSDTSQISMAIQKSKYDGTTESYNKWALTKSDNIDIVDNEGDDK